MKPITEVYPGMEESWGFCAPGDYGPLLASLGYPIVLRVDDGDYQGDSRLLLEDGGRYGWLQFGWGSCSGCDALQACDSVAEVEGLRQALHDQIRWFADAEEAADFFAGHDWEGDYSWHGAEQRDFVDRAVALLAARL